MSRLPIRVRLAAALAVAMSFVLALAGLFVYLRLEADLDQAIDSGLRSRADDVAALVEQADSGLAEAGSGRLSTSDESFAQVLREDGSVLDSTPGASEPTLDPAEMQALSSSRILAERQVAGIEGRARLLVRPVTAQGMRLVVVVGASLDDRREALDGLVRAFILGGPLAVLLVFGAGYLLASIGLVPVEAMRRRAEQVTLDHSGERLPLPGADDEIRRLGETLNAMLGRLEESFERERAFVADASHELRTPLSVLKAELEVTLRNGSFDDQTRSSLDSAIEEVDGLARLVEDLLVIARSQDGQLVVSREPADIARLIDGVVERHRRRAELRERAIEVDVAPDLEARIDSLRVRQAVSNLVDNALRHGDGGVCVRAARKGDQLVIVVEDGGPGFPEGFVDRAFLRFARGDPSRKRGGTGLGLAIVRAIAQAHDGDAEIRPLASGAAVVVRLRVA